MPRTHGEHLKGKVKADAARRERLAAELRANLKRRKDRSRALTNARPAARSSDADKS